MSNDFRVKYPLWQMAFIVLAGLIAFVASGAAVGLMELLALQLIAGRQDALEGFLFALLFLVFVLMLIAFSVNVRAYNRKHPQEKLSMWSVRPLEYLEQDEGMAHLTKNAVQKVYTFFVWSLPLMGVLYFFLPLSRFSFIAGILFLAFMQYLIYYREIRRHLKEDDHEA